MLGERLVRFGLKQSLLMNVLFIGLLVSGLYVVTGFGIFDSKIRVDRYPNFNLGEATVVTFWPGASAEEVERKITREIEDATRGVDKLEYVRASSRDGTSEIWVKFIDDSDYEALFNDLRQKVTEISPRLPVANGRTVQPIISKVETDVWLPVVQINLIPRSATLPVSRYRLGELARELRDRLETVPAVKRVDLEGISDERFEISLDERRLDAQGLSVAVVAAALRASGQDVPAGETRTGTARVVVADARWRSSDDVLAVAIRADGGRVVTVRDLVVADETGIRQANDSTRLHMDGRPTVVCKVLKDRDGDARRVRNLARVVVAEFLAVNPEVEARGATITPGQLVTARWNLDSAERAEQSLSVLQGNLLQGAVLILAVMIIMLSWRMAVLAASGVIVAFLGVILLLHLTGNSLNEITLLGLVLVAGILDDDVIVVVDNIHRKREEGLRGTAAIIAGAGEVIGPLAAASLTSICAFLPLLMMGGAVGQFFALLPITVALALAISLVECVFMVPLHIHDLDRWFGEERLPPAGGATGIATYLNRRGVTGRIARTYDHVLRWTIDHPGRTLGLIGVVGFLALGILMQSAFGAAWGLRPILRTAFFPEDTAVVIVTVRGPVGTALADTDELARRVGSELSDRAPELDLGSIAGLSGLSMDLAYRPVWGRNRALFFVELAPYEQRSASPAAIITRLRHVLESTYERDGWDIDVAALKDGPPTDAPVVIRLAASDPQHLTAAMAALRQHLASASGSALAGIADLYDDSLERSNAIRIRPDATRTAHLGLTPAFVVSAVAAASDGAYVGDLRGGDKDRPVLVRLRSAAVADPAGLAEVIIEHTPERTVRVGDVTTIALEERAANLVRRDYRRTVTLTANIASDERIDPNTVRANVTAWWSKIHNEFPGVAMAFGGEAEATARSFTSLGMAFLVAVALIFVILCVQFRSAWQPLLVMGNIAFAVIGVVIALGAIGVVGQLLGEGWVRPERTMLTVQTLIAIVGLSGMVIGESIVLVEFINLRQGEGHSLREALIISGHQRCRPIMMATLTTIAGLLTLAIGIPDFSMAWSPMAQAFIAGLSVSTTLTLIAVPAMYIIGHRLFVRSSHPVAEPQSLVDSTPRQVIDPDDQGTH